MVAAAPGITAPAVVPPAGLMQAPSHWRQVDFISDLHLQGSEPRNFEAWQKFMQTTPADAVFILGDLFDVWVGDDVMAGTADESAAADRNPAAGFEARCVQVLAAAAARLAIFLLHGNRDFLLGPAFAGASSLTLLNDPTVLDFAGQRWLLTHGDALCLDDIDYMRVRAQVRNPAWQQAVLRQPLAQRLATASALRAQSEMHQRSGVPISDINADAARAWLQASGASTLIHGHTHRPADHDLGHGLRRIVLSDWDADATPPRAEVLRLSAADAEPASRCALQRLVLARE